MLSPTATNRVAPIGTPVGDADGPSSLVVDDWLAPSLAGLTEAVGDGAVGLLAQAAVSIKTTARN
jgi:hypothetical protein